jgi:hypothetical protein
MVKGAVMKKQVLNVVYDTEGEGVEKVATRYGRKGKHVTILYRGKNGGWFFESDGVLMPTTEEGAYKWLFCNFKTDALNKYFPLKEA